MDANSQNTQDQIERLVRRSEASRIALGHGMQTLRHKMDVPARIKARVLSQPGIWFGAAAVSGLILARLIRPKSATPVTVRKSRGIRGLLFTAALAAAKPALKTLVLSQLKKHLSPILTTAQNRPSTSITRPQPR